ncbi:MAG: hypothetical protein J5601_03690 [Elusimicrobiaceae bacterium]|nr:hypothetical protein [Elusimicrobiaceae bacterium]
MKITNAKARERLSTSSRVRRTAERGNPVTTRGSASNVFKNMETQNFSIEEKVSAATRGAERQVLQKADLSPLKTTTVPGADLPAIVKPYAVPEAPLPEIKLPENPAAAQELVAIRAKLIPLLEKTFALADIDPEWLVSPSMEDSFQLSDFLEAKKLRYSGEVSDFAEFLLSIPVPPKYQIGWELQLERLFKKDPDALLRLLPAFDRGTTTSPLASLCYDLHTTLSVDEILTVARTMSPEGKFLLTSQIFNSSEPNMNLVETLLTEHQIDATRMLYKYFKSYPEGGDKSAKVAFLLEHGANVQESFNNTPWMQLAFNTFETRRWMDSDAPGWQDFLDTFRALQKHHVDVNATDAEGNTVLHAVAKLWSRIAYSYQYDRLREFNRFLVQEMGADPTIRRNYDYFSPTDLLLKIVTKEMKQEVVRNTYLIEKYNPVAWNGYINVKIFEATLDPKNSEADIVNLIESIEKDLASWKK